MKTKENEPNKTSQQETFLRIFDNVKYCKALDWEERAILSNHISFLINGQEFFQTDAFQAKSLGLSPAQISKYTGRLKERGLIETEMAYVPNPNGGRPIPKRYVTVIDMDKWTKGDKVPVVKAILSPSKKKLAIKTAELNKAKSTNTNITGGTITNDANTIEATAQQPVKTSGDSDKSTAWIKIVDSSDLHPLSKHELRKAINDNRIISEEHLNDSIILMKEMDLKGEI